MTAALRILLVIHGYPPRYNAGSENYTQQLAHGLRDAGHEVAVFMRQEDPDAPDFQMTVEADPVRADIPVYVVNHARSNARVQSDDLDAAFRSVLASVEPEVVHFGHLNHLSLGLPAAAKEWGAATLHTLHDFWLLCPRGQFLQWGLTPEAPWKLCDGQDDHKCATRCFNRFFVGEDDREDEAYWTTWVNRRMQLVRRASEHIDLFVSPAKHLAARHESEGIKPVRYLDYGFERQRCRSQGSRPSGPFVFAFVGRHHPSKGLPDLIWAFCQTKGDSRLRIWGYNAPGVTRALQASAEALGERARFIEWMGPFEHHELGAKVLDQAHALVVPSIWEENSPLVIHEAQENRLPVLTANAGGMAEYVQDGLNGLLFEHRDRVDLARVMQAAIDDPVGMAKLGKRGYLNAPDGSIPDVAEHVRTLVQWYHEIQKVSA